MRSLHEPAGLKRTNWQERQPYGRKSLPNFGEVRPISRIACKKHSAGGTLDYVAAPEGPVPVKQTPSREMPGWDCRNSNFSSGSHELPPVQLGRFGPSLHPVRYQTRADSKRNDKIGMPRRSYPAKCRHVQMIVVIVTLEHQINRGKILESDTRRSMATRPKM
jgi:hypothetical protein